MKISCTVLKRRFFESNGDRNGCRLNPKEIMRKLYRIIMKLCDWKLILMIEVIYSITQALSTQVTGNIRKLWNIIFGPQSETHSYHKLLIIWPLSVITCDYLHYRNKKRKERKNPLTLINTRNKEQAFYICIVQNNDFYQLQQGNKLHKSRNINMKKQVCLNTLFYG